MWDLPGPGIKPMSAALAGGFLTSVPPGKSQYLYQSKQTDRDKEGHYIMIKGSIQEEDVTIVNNCLLTIVNKYTHTHPPTQHRPQQWSEKKKK